MEGKGRKRKSEDDEGPRVRFVPSCGYYNLDKHFKIFEQIEGNKFIVGKNMQLQETLSIIENDVEHVYTPLSRVPWYLCGFDIGEEDPPQDKEELKKRILNPTVTTEDLWKEIHDYVYEHLFLPDKNLYDVLTAWVLATWISERWNVVPYIFFYGPVASGKTRGLEILQRLSYRGVLASSMSAAALFRASDAWHPTIFLDETEIYNKDTKTEVIGLLNSGYRRGQFAIRVKTAKDKLELECFDVFGFKALAGTRGLAKALVSRCIMIRTLKARRKIRRFIDEGKAKIIRNKLLRWRFYKLTGDVTDAGDVSTEGYPQLEFGDGRLNELFVSLLTVANKGHESIIKYAKSLAQIQELEEQASIEAEIIYILANYDIIGDRNFVATDKIAEIFNDTRSEKEKWKNKSIGWKMRELGFVSHRTNEQRGWLVDPERLEHWKEIFKGVTFDKRLEVYFQKNDTTDRNVIGKCFLCNRPILKTEMLTYIGGKPVHLECGKDYKEADEE